MPDPDIVTNAPRLAGLLRRSYEPPADPLALRDRCRGVMLGLAVGNLLGLPVEGDSRQAIARTFPNGITEIDPDEQLRPMDDDLAQAVDLGEALLAGGDYVSEFARRLVIWRRENGRGIGNTTSAVIDLLEMGTRPPEAARIIYEQRNRIAPNGGVMRCAPVALVRQHTPELLVRDSAATCSVTHYAATCQWSCIILNAAVALALRDAAPAPDALAEAAVSDGPPQEVWEWIAQVGHDIEDLRLDQGHIGHTLLALQVGMWALTTSHDFEAALVSIAGAGGDTDTNGAVAGAVLGARYGVNAIPRRWLDCVPQRERIEALADALLAGAG